MTAFKNKPLAKSRTRIEHARQQGLNGLQASTLGLVIVGCLSLGYFLGQWMDNRFGTNYWAPVMALVGLAAGFREFFHTVAKLNVQRARLQAEQTAELQALEREQSRREVQSSTLLGTEETADETPPKRRMFEIPEPPLASFEGGAGRIGNVENPVLSQSPEDVLEELLDEHASKQDENGSGAAKK